MIENFDLQQHIAKSVEGIVADALRATLKSPKQSAFMLRFAAASKKAAERRDALEAEGTHVPAFLIASITSRCNLHCAGCYSRCMSATTDDAPVDQLSAADWGRVFREAREMGISFILLAGGEPLLRRDVIEAAGEVPEILFPIFTNGSFFDEPWQKLFDQRRNLMPVLSIEGGRAVTDGRRGKGMYDRLLSAMEAFQKKSLLFGASVTVTTENIDEVTSDAFLDDLAARGCKLVVLVEYVPVAEDSAHLAPGDAERAQLAAAVDARRARGDDMMLISFPGDEHALGGCVAAGRMFFHINSHGGAEPCPFSPFADVNVRDGSLHEAMNSKLFQALRDGGVLLDEHKGGCVLYEKRDQVAALLASH